MGTHLLSINVPDMMTQGMGGGGEDWGANAKPQLREKKQRVTFIITSKNSLIADVKAIKQQMLYMRKDVCQHVFSLFLY